MRRLVASVLLAFPLCASADLVQLEYEGVVSSVTRTLCNCDPTRGFTPDNPEYTGYSVGDRLHGFLQIDLALAPPDREPLQPVLGSYPSPSFSSGFISGNGPPRPHRVVQDGMSVLDHRPDHPEDHPFEHYSLEDQWSLPNGSGQMGISVVSRQEGLDLVSGEGIAQNFDARPGGGLELVGYISKFVKTAVGSVGVSVGLLFDRVKVSTPGRCSM
jgi:hypothetical protein